MKYTKIKTHKLSKSLEEFFLISLETNCLINRVKKKKKKENFIIYIYIYTKNNN